MTAAPDNTAVRVALWRALHLEIDPPPHVLADQVGLRLAAPDEGWQRRRDMDPKWTSRNRASIVARARFVEDLVVEATEILELSRGAGCHDVRHVSAIELTDRYFAGRSDGLRPSSAEELIVATTSTSATR